MKKKQLVFPWSEPETVLRAILEEVTRLRQGQEHQLRPKQIFPEDAHHAQCEGCLEARTFEDEVMADIGEEEPPRSKKRAYKVVK